MAVKLTKRTRLRGVILLLLLLLVGGIYAAGELWALHHYRKAQKALTDWDFDLARQHLVSCSKVWWFRPGAVRLLQARTTRLLGNNDQAVALLQGCRALG